MAFSGPAPELINGRLAMLGVVAAIAAELASGESVLKQVSDEPTGIVFAFGIFIAASFAPLLSNVLPSAESVGPFNAKVSDDWLPVLRVPKMTMRSAMLHQHVCILHSPLRLKS
jgi:hypothetical protein